MAANTFESEVLGLMQSYGLSSGYFCNGSLFYDLYEPCDDDIGFITELQELFGAVQINESCGEVVIDFIAEEQE